ncbi:MAG: NAD(P)/FAD-dependent oxidoreductase [Candidatus Latescibacterota bacterium]|nr:MAG: NAD(P)/FAD-dependent oxidoreductase [Candidatus Latescibacterota bacterium]
MQSTKYLLIGGGLSSSQAGKIIRMKDPDGGITMVSKERHVPYDRPPLSKEILRGEKTIDELFFDPTTFFEEKRIELILDNPVQQLDTVAKKVLLKNGDAVEFEKALIATGGDPVKLKVPGSELYGVHYLRTIDDASAIDGEAAPGKRVVIIGAGFIGMEVASSLTQRGIRVTVIEALPRIWARFLDENTAAYFKNYCEQKGITFVTNEKVGEIRGRTKAETVMTESGQEIECDFVCVGIGIRPSVEIARDAGLDVSDGIVVNEFLQTSHPDIYAAGDVASYPDPVFGKRRRVEHWGHAEYSGQVAGLNMTGAGQKYDLLSYVWSDIFDLHIEFAGDESEHDRVLLRGNLDKRSFVVLYLKSDVLVAYLAVNTSSREYPKLQRLIRRKTLVEGKDVQLEDPEFDLKTLL